MSKMISFVAAVPAALACLGYEGGVPTPTGSKTLSEPMYIGAGETFDAGWVKYDRGKKCGCQAEGGKWLFFYPTNLTNIRTNDIPNRR